MRAMIASLNLARRRMAMLAMTLVVALTGGCGRPDREELSGPFGPGAGGAGAGTPQFVALSKLDGSALGALDYWSTSFVEVPPVAPEVLHLLDVGNGIDLRLSRIVGRNDTPCRYQAALLARDSGFTILASGARSNDGGLRFYQVNLSGAFAMSLYCATLRDNVGIAIATAAAAPSLLEYTDVHFVLNSVRP